MQKKFCFTSLSTDFSHDFRFSSYEAHKSHKILFKNGNIYNLYVYVTAVQSEVIFTHKQLALFMSEYHFRPIRKRHGLEEMLSYDWSILRIKIKIFCQKCDASNGQDPELTIPIDLIDVVLLKVDYSDLLCVSHVPRPPTVVSPSET